MTALAIVIAAALLVTNLSTHAAGMPASKQAWQYRWQVWLPDKWQRLGACETGYRVRPGNWSHDTGVNSRPRYVSAFGIEYGNYEADARFAGAPAWEKHPTPWQQFRTALAHYRLHFGFSGWGCRGA